MDNHTPPPPSLYPSPTPPTSPEPFPSTYEQLLQLSAVITSPNTPPTAPNNPILLRVIQGPLPPSSSSSSSSSIPSPAPLATPPPPTAAFHAFISAETLNIPLHPSHFASRTAANAFCLRLPRDIFYIQITPGTEQHLLDGFAEILQWFCQWSSDDFPSPTQPDAPEPTAVPPYPSQESPSKDRFAPAADTGVRFVQRAGTRLHATLQRQFSKHHETASRSAPRNLPLGGRATAVLLSGARRITHIGASIASTATEKISSGVGRGLAGNPVTKSLADAPEGSMRRRLFDDLTSGAACVGRVIVEADAQGRVLIEEVGRGTSSIAGAKYGTEAENVSKEIAGIALDTYRIVRFPHKLGASSLLKGAFKARFANGDGGSADNMNGMNTHAGMQEVGTDNNAVAGEGIANMNGMNMHAGGQEVGTGNDVAGAGVAAVPYAPYASPYSPQHTSLGPNGFVSRKEDGGRKI